MQAGIGRSCRIDGPIGIENTRAIAHARIGAIMTMAVPSLRKTRNKVVDSASAGAAGASHSDAANAMQVRLCIEDFRVMGRTKASQAC
jgi:hypothetical protein